MKIHDYITHLHLDRIDQTPDTRPAFVPPTLSAKFDALDDVDYYSDQARSRWVGICRSRDLFAASKPGVAVTSGTLDKDYPILDAF